MKKLNLFIASTLLVIGSSTFAMAAGTVTYRMSIDGDFSTTQPFLTAGMHTLVIEAMVSNNELSPGNPGGLFQSAFNLNTDNQGFIFTDTMGGFLGAPDTLWDSDDLIPPFDTHNRGVITATDGGGPVSGGGPFVVAETSAIAPGNFNSKFNSVGADVFSVVAQGTFNWDGVATHPSVLNLVVANPLGGDIVTAALSGGNVVGSNPSEVFNASITFEGDPNDGDPNDPVNTPPIFDLVMGDPNAAIPYDQQTLATFTNPANYQLQGTDAEDGDDDLLSWTLDSFTGPFSNGGNPLPGSGNGNQTLSSTGLFEWDPTGSNRGYYFANVTVMDSGGLTDTGVLRVQVPEPSVFVLAGLSLLGIVSSRRRLC